MLKKVLAVALFAALLLSMIPAVSAADGSQVSAVDLVVVGNFGDANVTINPHGDFTGSMTPVTAYPTETDNLLTIKGRYSEIADKTFEFGIVLNGQLNIEGDGRDFAYINHAGLSLDSASDYTTLDDGRSVLWAEFKVRDWVKYSYQYPQDALLDTGRSQNYDLHIVFGDGNHLNYSFKIVFVEDNYTLDDAIDGYQPDALPILNTWGDISTLPATIDGSSVGTEYTVGVSTYLNVRATPAGEVISKLGNGTKVFVVGYADKWAEILYGEGTAFIYTDFIG